MKSNILKVTLSLITAEDNMRIWHEMYYEYINLFTALYFLLQDNKKQAQKNGLTCSFVETFIFFLYPTDICLQSHRHVVFSYNHGH